MSNDPVIYIKKGHIGQITLNRPEAGNAVELALAQELAGICQEINRDEEVYVAVITGAGEVFCSGGDVRELFSGDVTGIESPAAAVAAINCPVIAVINGDAIGEGLEIALACDIRLASDTARFGLPQITRGGLPMDGGTQRLSRIVGKGKALEMTLLGEIIDAKAAYEIGLVNKVISSALLKTEADNLAATIAGKAPIALRYAKEAVNKGLDLTLEQGLRLEADLYFLIHTTGDRTEGIKSFLAKKTPQYKGK
jgi:enoyl-CoA hydratase/carnithine racemase